MLLVKDESGDTWNTKYFHKGEKLAANTDLSVDFVPSFCDITEWRNISLDQIFNCDDETGLNFRLLPEKTLAASFERSVDG